MIGQRSSGASGRSDGWGGYGGIVDGLAPPLDSPFTEEDLERAVAEHVSRQAHPGPASGSSAAVPGGLYGKLFRSVERPIAELRHILEAAEAKDKEREWLRGRLDGELDDDRLVDAVLGERGVFRKRGTPDLPLGLHQRRPKLVEVCMDVSSSMTRGQGWDGRLDRSAAAAIMIMNAMHGFASKIVYSISGHSGSGPHHKFVEVGSAPDSHQGRAEVAHGLIAHSRACLTGDSTLEAAKRAVARAKQGDYDARIVILVSDANLGRYGVTAEALAEALGSDKDVDAHIVFIAEPLAAAAIAERLPGKAHLCMDVSTLPSVIKEILRASAESASS